MNKKIKCLAATVLAVPQLLMLNCFGSRYKSNIKVSGNTDADTMMTGIIAVIFQFASYIGIALGIWGGVMFGLAVKNEEAESKQKALMTLIAGVILIALKPVAQSMGFV